MELTDSDEDDCQLYTRTAENFIKKRDEMQAKRKELEKVIDLGLLPEDEIENALNDENFTNRPIFTDVKSPKKRKRGLNVSFISTEDFLSSDDDVPLAELRRNNNKKNLRNNNKKSLRKNKRNKKPPSQVRDLGVIVLDDDTGYSVDSLPPIDFNSRSHNKSRLSGGSLGNISLENILNEESDDLNLVETDDLVTLTIEWNNCQKTTRKEFKLRRYQKFESVFEELARMENVSKNHILLMYDFNSVNPWDTPSSLNLKFYGALIGSISSTEITRNQMNIRHDNVDENISGPMGGILVKLLLQSKKTLLFKVLEHQKMDILYSKCAEELNCEKTKLKLTFDGEHIEPTEIVADLGIEEGDVFHVHVKNS